MVLQFLINGLVEGSVYSLVALGFGLIYTSTRVFHITHGAVYTLAAYIFYSCARILGFNLCLSGVIALSLTGILGACVEHFVYFPLFRREASTGVVLISSLGVYTVLVNLIAIIYGNEPKILSPGIERTMAFGPAIVTRIQLAELLTFVVIFPLFVFLMRKTRLGRVTRALATNPELVTVLGIDIRKVRLGIFVSGSILAGIASCLVALDVGIDPNGGMSMVLISAVAVIVGGRGIPEAPVVGAFLLGMLKNTIIWKISTRWDLLIIFLLLTCFLLLRPYGIVGHKRRLE